MCLVRAKIDCQGEQMYALESNKTKKSYNGQCAKCSDYHIHFENSNRGYYTSVKDIHDMIIRDKEAEERAKGPKRIDELPREQRPLSPLRKPILGKNKGIEGNSNSCYMDSTIFCMFAYSNVFDTLLNKNVDNKESVKDLQKLLRENIVGILRGETGFVERKSHSYAPLSNQNDSND